MGHRPDAPVYNTQSALAEQNRINQAYANQKYADVNSPLGGYSVSVDPNTGQMTINKNLSDNSQAALDAQRYILSNYTGDGTDAANAYYDAQMAYLKPQMERQVTRSESGLTNRGLPIGSSAWNEYMGDVYDAQNQQIAGIGNAALSAGQDYQSGILNQGAMLGGQVVDPTMVAGQGGAGLADTYAKQYQSEIDNYKTAMARYNAKQQAWTQALNPLGGMAGSAAANMGGSNSNQNITDVNGNVIGQYGGYGIYNG